VSYAFLSTAEIPISAINCSITNMQSSDSIEIINFKDCFKTNTLLQVDVSFPIYVIGILSFVSWFLFVLFGGIGIPALPLDFIYDFCTRPKKMSREEIERKKNKIVQHAVQLRELGREIKTLEHDGVLKKTFLSKDKREYNDKIRRLKAGVLLLDKEYEYIQVQTELNDSWVLHYYFGLLLGIITLLIALAWFAHM
jgi:LMBR1 domain-containing protein 1